MLSKIQRTGSIAQDALRLGFQATCNKGIATLLKVDDITVEECDKFKKQHVDEVEKRLETLVLDHTKVFDRKFKNSLNTDYYAPDIFFFRWLYYRKVAKQSTRSYSIKILDVEEAELNLDEGMWTTKVNVKINASAWVGIKDGCTISIKEGSYNNVIKINTRAKKCVVEYLDYDEYHHRYIPDEAAEAATEAIIISMTNIKVAFPKVIKSVEPQPDPIIIGHINKQMFIIAWFGYDKNNHMACNI